MLVTLIHGISRRLVLLSALSALGLSLPPAICSATSIAGPNGKIVFTSGRPSTGVPAPNAGDKGARLYVADYPSGTPVQVTTLPAGAEVRHRQPNWSPDHTRIAYAAGASSGNSYALWILDLRTGSQTEFVPAAEGLDRPSWSPDGTEIAYGAMGDLWVKGVAPGSTAVQLTKTATITEERPVWSPDGNSLYYNRKEGAGTKDLYKKSPVTLGGAETVVYDDPTKDAWQPALSPDGNRLCFLLGPQSSESDLFTLDLNGSSGPAKFAEEGPGVGELNCVWSPDGKLIMYTRGAFEAGELYTRAPNGSGIDALGQFNFAGHFDGNTDWATNFSPKCDAKSAQVAVNSFTTIALSCTDPDAGFGAEPPTPTPLDSGALEIASPPSHGNLGGLSKGKVVYTPKKDFKGTDTFTYVGSDEVSNSPPATVTVRVGSGGGNDTTAPTISGVKMSAKRWRLGSRLASISRTPVGTTIFFRLSEAARATMSFKRVKPNGRIGKSAGSISVAAKAGKNRVRFQGRLTKSRKLAAGGYTLVLTAKDAAGNKSKPHTGPKFTIVSK
jgi:hypothetical protein